MNHLTTWHDDWSLGIATLDQDHRALMERLIDIYVRHCPQTGKGTLFQGRGHGPSGPTMLEDLAALGAQADAHYRREERFMAAIGFEGVAAHAAEHARLSRELDNLHEGWRAAGVQSFDERALDTLRHALLHHILTSDRGFADAYHRLCRDGRHPAEES